MFEANVIKTVKARDLNKYLDYLVIASSGNTIYVQDCEDGLISFEYDDGLLFTTVPSKMKIMLLENGNLFINNLELTPYQSVKVNLKDKL